MNVPASSRVLRLDRDARALERHERVAIGEDRREALVFEGTEELALQLELAPGDRLRFAYTVAPEAAGAEKRRAALRVTWTPLDGERQVLDEILSGLSGRPWLERDLPIDDASTGAGTLTFATLSPVGARSVIAEPRVVHADRDEAPRPPNLLVYLIDTLRADRLSCYGAPNPTSPRIDRLADDGFLFERFLAVAPWTRPTTATLLTGYLPDWHGMGKELPLPASLDTLAESLATAGYSTWGAVANPQVGLVELGFDQGFTRFVSLPRVESSPTPSSRRLNDAVLPWIESCSDEPFFLYVHSLDPHTPYRAVDRPRFARDYDGELAALDLWTKEIEDRAADFTDEDRTYVTHRYDDEIARQDEELGRLLDSLAAADVLDDTIVVVVSDHGEELGEHGGWNHGYRMWDELLHVPFVLWLPERLRGAERRAPRRIPEALSQVDFLPGLLELLAVEDAFPRQGTSWVPLLSGESAALSPLFGVDYQARVGDEIGAFESARTKLVWRRDGQELLELELFDLREDPHERRNLARDEPERLERLLAERDRSLAVAATVRERLARAGRSDVLPHDEVATEEVELSEEERRELEALGYAGD